MSIQVDVQVHQHLHKSVHSMSPGLGDACIRATSKGAVKTVGKLTGIAVSRAAAKGSVVAIGAADVAETTFGVAIASSFRVGYSAAFTASTVGLVSGVALGANIIVEAPLLARSIYKIHRKEKFEVISSKEAKRQIAIESITSANTIIGGTAGAIAGQLAIPIPVVGAVVGGFCGVVAGKAAGNVGGGMVVAHLFSDKDTDLPVFLHCKYMSLCQIEVNDSSHNNQ